MQLQVRLSHHPPLIGLSSQAIIVSVIVIIVFVRSLVIRRREDHITTSTAAMYTTTYAATTYNPPVSSNPYSHNVYTRSTSSASPYTSGASSPAFATYTQNLPYKSAEVKAFSLPAIHRGYGAERHLAWTATSSAAPSALSSPADMPQLPAPFHSYSLQPHPLKRSASSNGRQYYRVRSHFTNNKFISHNDTTTSFDTEFPNINKLSLNNVKKSLSEPSSQSTTQRKLTRQQKRNNRADQANHHDSDDDDSEDSHQRKRNVKTTDNDDESQLSHAYKSYKHKFTGDPPHLRVRRRLVQFLTRIGGSLFNVSNEIVALRDDDLDHIVRIAFTVGLTVKTLTETINDWNNNGRKFASFKSLVEAVGSIRAVNRSIQATILLEQTATNTSVNHSVKDAALQAIIDAEATEKAKTAAFAAKLAAERAERFAKLKIKLEEQKAKRLERRARDIEAKAKEQAEKAALRAAAKVKAQLAAEEAAAASAAKNGVTEEKTTDIQPTAGTTASEKDQLISLYKNPKVRNLIARYEKMTAKILTSLS